MSRDLLHISKIEEFKAWLDKMALQHRPGRGDYQVLQVKNPTGPEWFCVFFRNNMPEHYTVDQRLEGLVRQFIKAEKETKDGQDVN